MLLFAYTHKRFVIFTCWYFKLSWNTTALSQSNCRNFSCTSIRLLIIIIIIIIIITFIYTAQIQLYSFQMRHVVVVQWRLRNERLRKSVMHVQSCYFANLNLLLFCRCRCRQRRHCLSSLMCKKERGVRWRHSPRVFPSRAPFFLTSITYKPLLRRLPNMPMHNLQNSASFMDTVESA